MFAVINHLHFSKPVDEFQSAVEQEGLSLLSTFPGFRDFYFVRVGEDRAVVIILWNSAAEAADGAKAFGSTWFAQNFAPYLASEQQRSVGEVLVQYEQPPAIYQPMQPIKDYHDEEILLINNAGTGTGCL